MKPFKYDTEFLKKVHSLAIDTVRTQSYEHNKQYLDGNQLVAKAWIDAFDQVLSAAGYEITPKKDNP